jgi:hypothetical protein
MIANREKILTSDVRIYGHIIQLAGLCNAAQLPRWHRNIALPLTTAQNGEYWNGDLSNAKRMREECY